MFFSAKLPLIKAFYASAVKMRTPIKSAHRSQRQRPNRKSLAVPRPVLQLTRPLHLDLDQLSDVDHPEQWALLRSLAQKLRARKKIVVISGAGISVNAGGTCICISSTD